MDKIFKEYKITQQRVWPFPNQIEQGSKSYIVTTLLDQIHITGPGKNLLDNSVIAEFNQFAFFDKKLNGSSKIEYSIVINSSDDLSNTNVDEGYELEVDKNIRISAKSYIGAVYALATLKQLIRKKEDQYVIENTPLKIVDSPKIAFRAVMLDCARNFLSVELIKQQIKAMSFQKLNYLHLHLTDSHSFPLAVGPLTKVISLGVQNGNSGAFSREETYSKQDIQELIDYAKYRGVRIIPEVDTPGHTFSWVAGHPDIMTCNDAEHQTQACCPEPPCGFFNIKEKFPKIKEVVSSLLNEIIDAFSIGKKGYGSYFHIGFDEVGCPTLNKNICTPFACTNAYGEQSVEYANWILDWMKMTHPTIQTIMWIDQVLTSNFSNNSEYTPNIKLDPNHVILHFWNLDSVTPLQIQKLATLGFGLINSQVNIYYLDSGGEGNSICLGGLLMSQASNGKLNINYQKFWMSTYPGLSNNQLNY